MIEMRDIYSCIFSISDQNKEKKGNYYIFYIYQDSGRIRTLPLVKLLIHNDQKFLFRLVVRGFYEIEYSLIIGIHSLYKSVVLYK